MAIEHINLEACVGCGMCEKHCPMDVIRFNKETRTPEIKFPQHCMLCMLCEGKCPVQAITVSYEKKYDRFLAWG